MGKVFELISDEALEDFLALDSKFFHYDKCDCCGRKVMPAFPMQGNLINPDGTVAEDIDFANACKTCIRLGRIRKLAEREVFPLLEKLATNPDAAKRLFRQTPDLPTFAQHDDWVICCGELTEFQGHPKNNAQVIEVNEHYTDWYLGFSEHTYEFEDDENSTNSLDEINLFKCCQRQRNWFTWQYT